MSFYAFFPLCAVVYALLHWIVIPAAERRLTSGGVAAAVRGAAVLGVLGILRLVALIWTATSLLLMLVVLTLRLRGGNDEASLSAAISRLVTFEDFLERFDGVWSVAALALLTLILVVHAVRASRRHVADRLRSRFEAEFGRLAELYDSGSLPEIAPSEEMQRVEAEITELIPLYESIDKSTTEGAQLHQRVHDRLALLFSYRRMSDIARRVELTMEEDDLAPVAPQRFARLHTLLLSRGLLAATTGTSRLLYIASIALLVPLSIGVIGVPATSAARETRVSLAQLRIDLVEKNWNAQKAKLGEPVEDLTEEEEQAIEQVSSELEARVSSPQLWRNFRHARHARTIFDLRSSAVAKDIVHRARQTAPTTLLEHASGSDLADLQGLEKMVTRASEAGYDRTGTVGRSGRRISEKLRDFARRSREFRTALVRKVDYWTAPGTPVEVRQALVSDVFGMVAEKDSLTPIGKIISEMDLPSEKLLAEYYLDSSVQRFVNGVLGPDGLDRVFDVATDPHRIKAGELRHVGRSAVRAIDKLPLSDSAAKMASRPAALTATPEPIDVDGVVREIAHIRSNPRFAERLASTRRSTEALATYGDWFPAQDGLEHASLQTQVAKEIESLGGFVPSVKLGTPPRPFSPPEQRRGVVKASAVAPSKPSDAFLRARNYYKLRGFARVGGVLIGMVPDAEEELEIRDLSWRKVGDKLQLEMVDVAGHTHRSLPYDPILVQQALAYAADGRPTTVTIVASQPLPDHKIHLHPALLDTALGHRAIELDQLIFRYFDSDTPAADPQLKEDYDRESKRVERHDALYTYLWAHRLVSNVQYLSLQGMEVQGELAALPTAAETLIKDSQVKSAAGEALRLRDFNDSLMTARPAYYDRDLVEIITRCTACDIDALTARAIAGGKTSDKKKLVRFFMTPPMHNNVSGVRERPFEYKAEALLVRAPLSGQTTFDFVVQVSFVTPPLLADDEEAFEQALIESAWTYPMLENRVHDRTMAEIARDPQAEVILRDMAQFTVVQRLFRSALAGKLGLEFPIEKLAELHEAATSIVRPTYFKTARWDPYDRALDEEFRREIDPLRKRLGVPVAAEKVPLPPLR